MERFDDIQTHRAGVQENILKAFGVDIEKGVYVNNAENRKRTAVLVKLKELE